MSIPVRFTRVPPPDDGSIEPAFIDMSDIGLNITGRQVKTGNIQVVTEFYGRAPQVQTIAKKATTRRYMGWWSAEHSRAQRRLRLLWTWIENDIRVRCNDDYTDSVWEIQDFRENEDAAYGKDQNVVDFELLLIRVDSDG